jgi:peptide/nickel transport system permease protein/oligopeptide transport system permease protein
MAMGPYAVRRLLQFIPVLIGTLFLLHYITVLSFQINGNPVRALFGDRQPPPETIAALTRAFGLDDPCLEQTGNPCVGMFVERIGSYIGGDFGVDFNQQPVVDLIARAAPVTLRLTLLAILFEAVVGVLAGVLAGLRKDRFADNFVRVATVLAISVPIFVLGVLTQIVFGLYIGDWVRERGAPDWVQAMFSVSYQSDYPWASLVVPAMVLGATTLGIVARMTRTGLIESLRSDYVRTGKAKGLRPRRIVGIHALRNCLIPVITLIGIDIGGLMAGAIVTEGIFNIPGIGGLVYRAAVTGETAIIMAVVPLLVLVYLVASLLVDLLYAVLDPRIRYD